jgi:predicted DNA-binding transcriptional regulator AlpA
MESRQLLDYPTALKLTGLARRTLFKRMREHQVVPYVNPADRRLRWLDRRDIEKLTQSVAKSREDTTA